MTFAELKTELLARGFDYLNGREAAMINRGKRALDGYALWPYREASASGTAPLTVTDLGVVEMVIDVSNSNAPLSQAKYGELVQTYGDLTVDGVPCFWYRGTPGGVPTIATYPESTHTIGVQYYKILPDLSAAGDEPEAPDRWHDLIVDLAAIRAYRDQDNHQAAESLQVQVDRDLAQMVQEELTEQVQGPQFIQTTWGSDDS